ncbi:P-loop containing nucleoside triphosphate hydrolase protein, partial [Hygrophoropsis aurantiaca]
MPTDTHDFQVVAIAHLLDGDDVLLITATGSGKTDAFIRLMHVVQALSEDSRNLLGISFPRDPAMILVCPTKALEGEMEGKMRDAQLTALAINSDTVEAARKEGKDLFKEVLTGITMVLVSPEELASKGFEFVLHDKQFSKRVCMMAVDESHLLILWGMGFRTAFQQIGWMRSRLRRKVPLLAVTATLRAGAPTEQVCKFLGFQPGQYHILRRSNMRHDIQLIFRVMQSGLGAVKFPELDWILEGQRRTLIFCKTIFLGFRVDVYLWHKIAHDPHRAKRIRMFNALNDKSYNDQTLAYWKANDPSAQIIIATSILSVGIDAPTFDDVVIFGEPDDSDEYWQEIGRLRHMKSNGPRGILYATKGAATRAAEVIDAQAGSERKGSRAAGALQMQVSMAELLMADCIVKKLDQLYDNPSDEASCTCTFCAAHPRAPQKAQCDCSG